MSSHIKIHPDFQLNEHHFNNIKDLMLFVKDTLPKDKIFVEQLFNHQTYITAHTSGSTGKPKEIKLKKEYLVNSAKKTINFFELPPKSSALLNLSSDFIAGKMMWIRAIIGGWHLDIVLPENKNISKQLKSHTYNFGAMVPLQAYQNSHLLHKIDKLIIGGGIVSEALQKKLDQHKNKIYATYGMTETITHIAVKALNNATKKELYKNQSFINTYQLLDNITISQDQRNCLIIKAPDISNNSIITNDIVEIIDEKHFKWIGRYDNIINSGGLKFIPEQIEAKLAPIIDENFFIAGIPDEKLGEKIILIIETKQKKENINFEKYLTSYEIPQEIYYLSKFIKTTSGKIKRNEILQNLNKHN